MKALNTFGLNKVGTLARLQEILSSIWKNSNRRGHMPNVSSDDIASVIWHHRKMNDMTNNLQQAQIQLSKSFKYQKLSLVPPPVNHMEKLANQSRNMRLFRKELYILIKQIEHKLENIFSKLPNFTHPNTPYHVPITLGYIGNRFNYKFTPRDHTVLNESLKLYNLATATKVAHFRFSFFTGWGAILAQALENWALNFVIQRGFIPIIPPDIVKNNILEGCGFNPQGPETQVYQVHHEKVLDISLSGTGEIPLMGMFSNRNMYSHQLPQKVCAATSCYRAEAGDRGRAIRGLFRLHQFRKVEMVAITHPSREASLEMFNEMHSIQKDILNELGLYCRVLEMPHNDLAAPAYRKFDIEAYLPGMDTWAELTSASECLAYQTSRLNILLSTDQQVTSAPFSLNATALAVPRTMLAILETHQNADGSVNIPSVLQPYVKTHKITPDINFSKLSIH